MASPFNLENQQDQPDSKLVVAFEKLSESIRVLLWEQTKKHGLSPIQIQILIFLKNHGSDLAKPAVLAKELNVTRPTISDALKSLTQKGLLSSKPNPDDSRSRLLSLTSKAETLTKELEQYASPVQQAIGALNQEQQSTLLHGTIKLVDQLEKANVISPQRLCFNCAFYEGDRADTHYCSLLKRALNNGQLRIDCPEHKAA